MQGLDWNDLRVVLAVGRDGTLAAAARRLAVDETTVGRRLAGAERRLAVLLFARVAGGGLRPTRAARSRSRMPSASRRK